MPYELPAEAGATRRSTILRWASFLIAVLLVVVVAYLGYVGFAGSAQVTEPESPSRDCRTPAIAYGWSYEAINYDAAGDSALADLPDPTACPQRGAPAGDALQASDGVKLAGWYVPASSGAGPTGATVVLAHGHGANKSGMLAIADVLHEAYNLVLFDFRNHGQSGDAATTVGVTEQRDLRAVIDWLDATKHPAAIAVLGQSMGGAVALQEARADPRVSAVVLDSTHATLANALQARLERSGYPLSLPGAWAILLGGLVRTGQDMSAADPLQAVERLGDRPLLIITGGNDDSIGPDDAQDLERAATDAGVDAELEVCEPAGHAESVDACPDDYAGWVLGFLSRALGSAS
ncbi:MAG TPA: alpha/beta hydrolase [Candidatus Limnocylindria bacterium]